MQAFQCRSADKEEVDEAFFKQLQKVSYLQAMFLTEDFNNPNYLLEG